MSGRKATTVLRIIEQGNKSHLTKAEIEKRKEAEEEIKKLNSNKIKPPKWLGKEAKKIFKDIAKELEVIDLLANVDIYALSILSDCMEKYIKCTVALHAEEMTTEYTNKKGIKNIIENPLIKTQLKYAEMMKKYSSEYGLTPAARLKIVQNNTPELDEEEKEFRRDFG